MLTRFIEWKKIRSFLTFAVYMLAAMFLQSVLFSRLSIFGVKGFILPAAAVAAGIYLGGVRGAVFGLFLGLFTDFSFTETTVLFTLLFPVIGFASGIAADFYINKSFFAFMVFSAAAILLTGIVQLLSSAVLSGAELLPGLVTVLLQTLWSLLPAALLYLPFKNRS